MESTKEQVRVQASTASKLEWFDAVLADGQLSAGAKNVAARLLRHHNDRTGQCNPSHRRIAEGLGLSAKYGRKHVCKLVAELKAAGWIEASGTTSSCEYRLMVDRLAVDSGMSGDELDGGDGRQGMPPTDGRGCHQQRTGGAANRGQGVPPVGDTNHQVEPASEPSKRTTHQTLAPAEAASAPVAVNDNRTEVGGEVFSGWTIPEATMQEWSVAFPHLNLRGELVRRVPWFIANVPENRRNRALASKLGKVDEEARQNRLNRKDATQADVAAGVSRDNYGRPVPGSGWIANPRARPPGTDRFWMPPTPGQETVFRGTGYSIRQIDLDALSGRYSDIDLRAAITGYERDHGSVERTYEEHVSGLNSYLAAMPESQAA